MSDNQQQPAGAQQQPSANEGATQASQPAANPGADTAQGAKPAEGQQPADKTADTSAASLTGDEPAKEEQPKAPEKYEDFKLPETVKANPVTMEEFQALAKEHNLSQESAQKFAELGAKMMEKNTADNQAMLAQAREQWANESKLDPEFGGEAFEGNLALAKKALSAVGSPKFTELLRATGLGGHPEVIRTFFKIGKLVGEDQFGGGARETGAARSIAETLFPNQGKA